VDILFVCTGNTCRSPMAAAIAGVVFANRGLIIASRGVAVVEAAPSANALLAVMDGHKCDISAHIPTQIAAADMEIARIIITMTPAHKSHLLHYFPDYAKKVHTLADHVGESLHIADPYGGNLAQYIACAAQLADYIKKMEAAYE